MFDYRSDSEVCRYQSFEPGSLGDIEAFIGRLQTDEFDVPGSWFQLAIRLEDSGQLIGDFGVHFCADEPRQAEIGFTLSPHYQGRGYATEAVIGVFDHLFGPLQKRRVFASVDPRNEPSVALLKRVGMRQEAHFRKSLWFKGDWVDDMVFGILAEEWNGR
jgi:RimJ/RimL family protein N-acetyltransferase